MIAIIRRIVAATQAFSSPHGRLYEDQAPPLGSMSFSAPRLTLSLPRVIPGAWFKFQLFISGTRPSTLVARLSYFKFQLFPSGTRPSTLVARLSYFKF
jgi:hypothetical protein